MIVSKADAMAIKRGELTARIVAPTTTNIQGFRLGHSYGIQAHSKQDGGPPKISPEVCRVRVVGLIRCRLDQVTNEVSAAAGFEKLEDLYRYWQERYKEGPLDFARCMVVLFELDHTEQGLFLRPGPRGGYTTSPQQAMRDEPEAVPLEWLDGEAARARQGNAERAMQAEAEHKARPLWERLQIALQRAERGGVDVHRGLAAIERRVDSIEAKLKREGA